MILKEVVTNYLFNDEIIQAIANYWKKHYYQEEDITVGNIEEKLVKLREELDTLDITDAASTGEYSFTAKWIEDAFTEELVMDIFCTFNEDGKHYSIDYLSFKEMLHYNVIFPLDIPKIDFLSELLWEVTFEGFTEESKTESRRELENRIQESDEVQKSMADVKAFIVFFKEECSTDKRISIIDHFQPLTESVIEDWSDIFDETEDESSEVSFWSNVAVQKQDKQLLEEFLQVFKEEYDSFVDQKSQKKL